MQQTIKPLNICQRFALEHARGLLRPVLHPDGSVTIARTNLRDGQPVTEQTRCESLRDVRRALGY